MIQRIQTVYWLLATIALAVWACLPYATIESPAGALPLSAVGLQNAGAAGWLFIGWGTLLLGALVVALLLVAIFSYRRPSRQLRASTLSALLLIGLLLLECYYIYSATATAEGIWRLKIALWLPLLAAFFAYAGHRGVRRDQAFLRRMDRIR